MKLRMVIVALVFSSVTAMIILGYALGHVARPDPSERLLKALTLAYLAMGVLNWRLFRWVICHSSETRLALIRSAPQPLRGLIEVTFGFVAPVALLAAMMAIAYVFIAKLHLID